MIFERKPGVLPEEAALSISSSQARRDRIASQVDEFLSRGGEIAQIEQGVLAQQWQTPRSSNPNIAKAHARNTKYVIDCGEIRVMLGEGKTTQQICEHYIALLGCSKATVMAKISSARGAINALRKRVAA